MKRFETIFTAILVVTGIGALIYARRLPLMGPPELSPGLFPTVASVLIIVLGSAHLVTLVRAPRSSSEEESEEFRPLWIPLLLTGGYVALLGVVHFIAASIVYATLLMWNLYGALRGRIVITAILSVLIIYGVFTFLLGVRLP